MSAKLGFAAGLAVGVLAGSRAGRGLYDRSAAAATAVVHDPRVRSGASAALHRAGSAGSTVAGAAVRKVRDRRGAPGEEDEQVEGAEQAKDAGKRELGGRRKRLMGGARKHGVKMNGHGGIGVRGSYLHRWNHTHQSNHSRPESNEPQHSGVSAPSVQAKPKGEDGRADQAPAGEG